MLGHTSSISKKVLSPSYTLGLQVFGKSNPIITKKHAPVLSIPPNKNKFDFQVANEKNMNYVWALYAVDRDELEERMELKEFSIKDAYNSYAHK